MHRHAFISVHDAADVLAASVDASVADAVEVGGPQVLSWTDAAHTPTHGTADSGILVGGGWIVTIRYTR